MIPPDAALIAYIPVAFLLMADRNAARGFSLAVILGLLLLPAEYKLHFRGVPDLDKDNVPLLGAALGTIVFHPRAFDRFSPGKSDLLLAGMCGALALASLTNGFGAYDAVSQSLNFILSFALLVFLARLHLATPAALRTFLLTLVFAACMCAPFALWEFRMSPQLHYEVYGYFQHVFAQHMRGGFFRPILFFYHALTLGRFFAFAAFLALLPMRRDLIAMFGWVGNFVWLLPFAGLLVSMSYGPWMLFMLLCGGYCLIERGVALHIAVPAAAAAWMAVSLLGLQPASVVVEGVSAINPERASSLEYRLDAIGEYRSVILTKPLFGWGAWQEGRIPGRATDSQMLIVLLQSGLAGAMLIYGWWFSLLAVLLRLYLLAKGTIFGQRVAAIATLCALAIAVSVVDAALDKHLVLLCAGAFGATAWLHVQDKLRTRGAAGLGPRETARPVSAEV